MSPTGPFGLILFILISSISSTSQAVLLKILLDTFLTQDKRDLNLKPYVQSMCSPKTIICTLKVPGSISPFPVKGYQIAGLELTPV